MLGHRLFLTNVVLLAMLSPAAGAQTLEDLSAGASCPSTYGEDIAPDGTVAVSVACPDGTSRAALAAPGMALREFAPGNPTAIGPAGHVAVGAPSGTAIYSAGVAVALAPLAGYAYATVRDIASDGTAVGSSSTVASGSDVFRGTVWSTLGGGSLLGGLSPDADSTIVGISPAGMAGSTGRTAWRRRPDGAYVKLGSLYARRDRSWAHGMSSAVDVVGESEDKSGRLHPVVWPASATAPVQLPEPRRGWINYFAVNASRVVVGQAASGAVAWSPRSGLVDLNRYTPAGVTLRQATAVNDAGQVTGYSTRAASDRAFRLTLPAGF
jgi:hypothetical protein